MRRLAFVLLLSACAGPAAPATPQPGVPAPPPQAVAPARTEAPARYAQPATGRVQLEMRKVFYRPTDHVAMDVIHLRGEMEPIGRDVAVLGDATTFRVRLRKATIRIPAESLAAVLNERVFAGGGAPVKDLSVSTGDGVLTLRGRLHDALPFETKSRLSAEPDGRIRVHELSIDAAGVGVTGVAREAGVRLVDLVGKTPGRGVTAEGNDLLLEVARIVPPPEIDGPVRAVSVETDGVHVVFGADRGVTRGTRRHLRPPMPGAPHWIYLDGGTLNVGRLTMNPARMQIADKTPEDPFSFHQQRFEKEQLPKGSERVMLDGGLEVFVPDWSTESGQQAAGVSGRE